MPPYGSVPSRPVRTSMMTLSSAGSQGVFRISGFRWLYHLIRDTHRKECMHAWLSGRFRFVG